ncbi:MAG TPA: hypothetical protein VFI33_14475 [Puia sp.]|nr:hypothetical protein [Puia sp.]
MTTQEKNFVKAKKTIKTEEAENFIREYKQKRWVHNSERIGKPDSLSAWYSIEQLQKVIDLSKSHGGNGIRFFYGAYPENYSERPEYAGRQTLIMVPTKSRVLEDGYTADKNIYTVNNGRIEILGIGNTGHPTACPPSCPPPDGGMGDLGITIVDRGSKGMEIV